MTPEQRIREVRMLYLNLAKDLFHVLVNNKSPTSVIPGSYPTLEELKETLEAHRDKELERSNEIERAQYPTRGRSRPG